jgi:hypothetical protein
MSRVARFFEGDRRGRVTLGVILVSYKGKNYICIYDRAWVMEYALDCLVRFRICYTP